MVTDGNPDSMTGSKKKSNPMNANGVGNGVGILRQSTHRFETIESESKLDEQWNRTIIIYNLVYEIKPPY
jgi:hypothetical protein